jgi:carnitine 3-dehydrogenase
MNRGDSGETLATAEHMLVHVDTASGRASPWREPVGARVAAAAAAHEGLPAPEGAGRAIAMR